MFPVEPISGKMLDYYVGRKDSFLIDLRNPKEYHTGHIKGAVNVPYEKFEEMQTYDFPKGKSLSIQGKYVCEVRVFAPEVTDFSTSSSSDIKFANELKTNWLT